MNLQIEVVNQFNRYYFQALKHLLFFGLTIVTMALTGCDKTPKANIYIAIEGDETELGNEFLYKVSRQAKGERFVIDQLDGKQAKNLYSNPANRRAIQEIKLKVTSVQDQALIEAFQRIKDLAEKQSQTLHAYILTSGTSDARTLQSISYLCQKIATTSKDKVYIYLIGLSPEHRVPVSTALKPLAEQVGSSSDSYNEWIQLVRKF